MSRQINCHNLGLIDYRKAWELQKELHMRRVNDEIPDTLLLLEHPAVFTLGKRDCPEDLLSSPEAIASDGIEIIKTDRGGRITYHGPGQLLGYFICNVNEILKFAPSPRPSPARGEGTVPSPLMGGGQGGGVKRFVFFIEELLIRVLAEYGVRGERDPANPGVFVGRDKIAAIGLHVSRGVTSHGFALNVNPDLNHYRHIVPCGIKDRGVTSLERLMAPSPKMEDLKSKVRACLREIFHGKVNVIS